MILAESPVLPRSTTYAGCWPPARRRLAAAAAHWVVVLIPVLGRRSTVTLGHHTSSAVNTTASVRLCHGPADFRFCACRLNVRGPSPRLPGRCPVDASGLVAAGSLTLRSGHGGKQNLSLR
jgi:hypothetical protein